MNTPYSVPDLIRMAMRTPSQLNTYSVQSSVSYRKYGVGTYRSYLHLTKKQGCEMFHKYFTEVQPQYIGNTFPFLFLGEVCTPPSAVLRTEYGNTYITPYLHHSLLTICTEYILSNIQSERLFIFIRASTLSPRCGVWSPSILSVWRKYGESRSKVQYPD